MLYSVPFYRIWIFVCLYFMGIRAGCPEIETMPRHSVSSNICCPSCILLSAVRPPSVTSLADDLSLKQIINKTQRMAQGPKVK